MGPGERGGIDAHDLECPGAGRGTGPGGNGIPLFAAQFQESEGRPSTLAELSEQFGFQVPGEADVMLRIMESDPRMPPFLERDPASGEILHATPEALEAYGSVSVYPTFFFVDAEGVIVSHGVNFQERAGLEAAIQKALEDGESRPTE